MLSESQHLFFLSKSPGSACTPFLQLASLCAVQRYLVRRVRHSLGEVASGSQEGIVAAEDAPSLVRVLQVGCLQIVQLPETRERESQDSLEMCHARPVCCIRMVGLQSAGESAQTWELHL